MLKIIGFLFVLAGGSGVGFSLAKDYKKRIHALRQIKQMLSFINGKITYEVTPLPEAFRRCSERMEEPFKVFLCKTAQQMEDFSGESIAFLWKSNCKLLQDYLDKKDLEKFANCMGQTGFADAGGQRQMFSEYEKTLEEQIELLEKEREEKCKLYQTVGIMAGIFVCILFW